MVIQVSIVNMSSKISSVGSLGGNGTSNNSSGGGSGSGSGSGTKPNLDHQLSYLQHADELKKQAVFNEVLNFLSAAPILEIDMINEETGLTKLIKACEDNSLSDVISLLDQGAGVNVADSSGRSPLMVASAEGNMEILTLILEFKRSNKKKRKGKDYADNESDSDSVQDSTSDYDSDTSNPKRTSSFMEKILRPSKQESLDKRKSRDGAATCTGRVNSEKSLNEVSVDENDSPSKVEGDKRPLPTNDDYTTPPRRMSLIGLKNLLKPDRESSLSFEAGVGSDKPEINIEAKDKYGWTALMYAALCGQESIALVLIEHGADLHAVNIKERTALHIAITYGRLNVAAMLLQRGADINRLDRHEWTPAMGACKRGELEAVTFSIEHGAFLTVNKNTLLIVAATYGHLDLVINLLERKVKPSLGLRDIENELVLINAAEHKHILIVQFMLEYGVNINAVNELKQNALIVACWNGNEEIINFLLQCPNVDIFHEDDMGYTAFLHAASNNLIQVVKLLISKGVKVNTASSKSGVQALMCAAKSGHFKLVNLLLDHYGAKLNAIDFSKKSALHYSCIGGHAEVADLLIAKGALYKKDAFNCTPLYHARYNGHFEVAATLEHKYGDKKILMRADLQPVANCFDIVFLTVTSTACYVDIVFDVINAYTFYREKQFNYFFLALFFQVIPICAAVTLQKGWGTKLMAIFHLSVIREFYHSIRGKVETPMMCTLRIIETCLEACPSALLQLFVLVNGWLLETKDGHSAKGFYGVLPSSQERLLFLSILIAIGSSSITFIKFLSSEKDRLQMPVKSLVNWFVDIQPERLSNIEVIYCYHCCEEFFRLLTLAVLFVALRGWALLAIAVSYVLRMTLSTVIYKAENFTECTTTRQFIKILLRIALAQITDCLWYNNFKLTLHLQILTTLEGLACSLFLLYVDDTETDTFNFDRIQILLIVGGITWILKTSLYFITYFWMGSEASSVLIVDDDGDFGQYYSSSRNLNNSNVDQAVECEEKEKAVEEYESHAVADRKNYFSSIMKGVKKTREKPTDFNYTAFPPMLASEIELLKSVCVL